MVYGLQSDGGGTVTVCGGPVQDSTAAHKSRMPCCGMKRSFAVALSNPLASAAASKNLKLAAIKLPTMDEMRKKRAGHLPPLPPQTTWQPGLTSPCGKRGCDPRRHKHAKVDATGISSPSSTCSFDQHGAKGQSGDHSASVQAAALFQRVQQLIQQAHKEMVLINSSRPQSTKVRRVFGWDHCVWHHKRPEQSCQQTEDSKSHQMIFWKSAKEFTGLNVDELAQTIWQMNPRAIRKHFPSIQSLEIVHKINAQTQLVCIAERFGDRQPQRSLWIKFMARDAAKKVTYICWKQILAPRPPAPNNSNDNCGPQQQQPPPQQRRRQQQLSASEVRGYILREQVTNVNGELVRGCRLHSICSMNTRNQTCSQFLKRLGDNLPTLTLQWEELYTQRLEMSDSLKSFFADGPSSDV